MSRRGRIEGAGSDGAASGLTVDGLREYGERAGRFAALLDAEDLPTSASTPTTSRCPRVARRVLDRVPGWPGVLGA